MTDQTTTDPTTATLDRLDTLRGDVTDGPWQVTNAGNHGHDSWVIEDVIRWRGQYTNTLNLDEDRATADFIVASHAIAPVVTNGLRALLAMAQDWEQYRATPYGYYPEAGAEAGAREMARNADGEELRAAVQELIAQIAQALPDGAR